MTRLARDTDLPGVDVAVTADAGSLQPSEVNDPPRRRYFPRRDVCVAGGAARGRMFTRQCERRLCVVERRLLETCLRVTGLAVLTERTSVHIVMACGAGVGPWLHLHRGLLVTRRALHADVTSDQWKSRAGVIDLLRPP